MKKVLVSLLSIALIGCSMPMLNNTSQYSDLDKEYSQFKTEALTQSYLKKKIDKWLSDGKYSKNLVREIEYAKFKHKDLLKDIVALQPTIFDNITANTGVNQKRVESPFENYIQYINPYPSSVTALDATNVTSTSFTANWNSVTGATGYKLYIDGTLITLGNVTTYNVTGLVDASSHSYYVKAINSAGESSVSNTINLNLSSALPMVPTAIDATNITSTSFTSNWSPVSGATSYKLKVDSNTPIDVGNVTSYSVTGLTVGTTHTYSVQAVNSGNTGSSSNNISVTLLPSTPVATDGTNITTTSFTANWNLITGATSYKLKIDNDTPIDVGNVTSYSVTGLTIGSSHTYSVQAVNSGVASLNSNIITANLEGFTTLTEINSIATYGATSSEYFTVGTDNYLAFSNLHNDSSYNIGASIFKWNTSTSKFDTTAFQSLSGYGSNYCEFFTIGSNKFFALSNRQSASTSFNINSYIYKWNDTTGKFDTTPFQNIATNGSYNWKHFTIGSDDYLAVANYTNGSSHNIDSKIYKWNGSSFVEYQLIGTNSGRDFEFFTIGTDNYIAVANLYNGSSYTINSYIYKWNTSTNKFDTATPYQSILTTGAIDWEHFTIGTDHYLAVANFASSGTNYSVNSKIYKWNGSQFVEIQSIATLGSLSIKHFSIGDANYLAVSNYFNGANYALNSKIYKFNPSTGQFVEFKSILTYGASAFKYFKIGINNYLSVGYHFNGTTHNLSSKVYKLD